MLLRGSDGQSFQLRVLGYQFPNETTDYWDANWLYVAVSVEHPRGGWSAIDPSLLTFEVARLADWFDSLAQGGPVDAEEEFTEPNLAFRLSQGGSGQALCVYFELESRPAWAGRALQPRGQPCSTRIVVGSRAAAA